MPSKPHKHWSLPARLPEESDDDGETCPCCNKSVQTVNKSYVFCEACSSARKEQLPAIRGKTVGPNRVLCGASSNNNVQTGDNDGHGDDEADADAETIHLHIGSTESIKSTNTSNCEDRKGCQPSSPTESRRKICLAVRRARSWSPQRPEFAINEDGVLDVSPDSSGEADNSSSAPSRASTASSTSPPVAGPPKATSLPFHPNPYPIVSSSMAPPARPPPIPSQPVPLQLVPHLPIPQAPVPQPPIPNPEPWHPPEPSMIKITHTIETVFLSEHNCMGKKANFEGKAYFRGEAYAGSNDRSWVRVYWAKQEHVILPFPYSPWQSLPQQQGMHWHHDVPPQNEYAQSQQLPVGNTSQWGSGYSSQNTKRDQNRKRNLRRNQNWVHGNLARRE